MTTLETVSRMLTYAGVPHKLGRVRDVEVVFHMDEHMTHVTAAFVLAGVDPGEIEGTWWCEGEYPHDGAEAFTAWSAPPSALDCN